MFRLLQAFVVGFALCLMLGQTAAAEPEVTRKKAWSKVLEQRKFAFSKNYSDLLFSVNQNRADCEIHMIADLKPGGKIEIKFIREGQEIISLMGHKHSTFKTFRDKLYFVQFSDRSLGGTVLAYDLKSGKKLWQTDLRHAKPDDEEAFHREILGVFFHGMIYKHYPNLINIGMSSSRKIKGDEEIGSTITLTGRNSYCDYVEVLDSETGESLAIRNYRVFSKPNPKNKVVRQKAWRQVLDRRKHHLPKDYNGLLTSLEQFRFVASDCEIHVVYKPNKSRAREFRFVRDGCCEILSLPGHEQSAFTSSGNTLYYAGSGFPGCMIQAYDLTSGEKLWETYTHHKKPGFDLADDAGLVAIRMSSGGEIKDGIKGDAIIITGSESYCDYTEVLDAKTGALLAIKNYRVGYGKPKSAKEAPDKEG